LSFASRRRHTRSYRDWSSDVCSSDLDCVRQAESISQVAHADGKRDLQSGVGDARQIARDLFQGPITDNVIGADPQHLLLTKLARSEERRVGKEGKTSYTS